jgi:hypothetical protein
MGKGGFSKGQLYAQNKQAGGIVKALGGTGTDTTSVSFAKVMVQVPRVNVTATNNKDVRVYVSGKTQSGFTLNMISSTLTGLATFDYECYDDSYR